MVTTITATYKRPEYLKRAINSLISQTYKDLEIIIIDDNAQNIDARESTINLIRQINDSRIILVLNESNIGGAASRNIGINLAKGDYICFLDDDDLYLPTKIEVQLAKMTAETLDVSVMDGATYDANENIISIRKQGIKNNMTKNELIRLHLISHISGTNSFMFKTTFIQTIGGFDDVPACHEYFLMMKALNKNPKFGYIPQILIKNYMHSDEHISTSLKKALGQKLLIECKRNYFYLLSASEKAKVMCRHHGVLFFVYFKNKKYLLSILEAIQCFISSPSQSFIWYKEYRKKITT